MKIETNPIDIKIYL